MEKEVHYPAKIEHCGGGPEGMTAQDRVPTLPGGGVALGRDLVGAMTREDGDLAKGSLHVDGAANIGPVLHVSSATSGPGQFLLQVSKVLQVFAWLLCLFVTHSSQSWRRLYLFLLSTVDHVMRWYGS